MVHSSRWTGRAASRWLTARLIAAPRWHQPAEQQRCAVHLASQATDRCDRCGQPFCADCLVNVGRWRICHTCLARLERQRAGPSVAGRLRALWPPLLATLVVGVLLAVGVLAIGRGMGDAAQVAPVAVSAKKIACLRAYPDPARLYVVGGLPLFGSPPEHLALENCAFRPGEAAIVTGGISGYDSHGQTFAVSLGPVRSQVGDDGVLVVAIAIPDDTVFQGSYRITLRATGGGGSTAAATLSAEGNLAQPTHVAGG